MEDFLTGKPTIYDIGSYFVIVMLMCVVLGMHFRQIKHNRLIAHLQKVKADKQP